MKDIGTCEHDKLGHHKMSNIIIYNIIINMCVIIIIGHTIQVQAKCN